MVRIVFCVALFLAVTPAVAATTDNLLAEPGFESTTLIRASESLSGTLNRWGAENASVVGATMGISPFETQMLQVEATGGGSSQNIQMIAVPAELYRGIDAGAATVAASAFYNVTAASPDAEASLLITFNATGSSPPDIDRVRMDSGEIGGLDTDTATWQRLAVEHHPIPPGTRYLVIQLIFTSDSLNEAPGFIDEAALSVTTPTLDGFMGYQAKESDKTAPDGALPSPCTIALDDPLFDFADGETTQENYTVGKVRSLLLPADQNAEGVIDAETHLLSYQIKEAKQGALPVATGKFSKARKHVRRTGVRVTVASPSLQGSLVLTTNKVRRMLVPTSTDLSETPAELPTGTVDHYKCYQVKGPKVPPFGTLQDTKGRLGRNVQVLAEDEFQDGLIAETPHPAYGGAKLYDLKKITELCVPVAKSNIDAVEQDAKGGTRTTACHVAPASINDPVTGLVCFQAGSAKKSYPQPPMVDEPGTKIAPKQSKHTKRSLKNGSPVYVSNQLSAPDRLDTKKERELCVPVRIDDAGSPPTPAT